MHCREIRRHHSDTPLVTFQQDETLHEEMTKDREKPSPMTQAGSAEFVLN